MINWIEKWWGGQEIKLLLAEKGCLHGTKE
jgi:hypothetical protein